MPDEVITQVPAAPADGAAEQTAIAAGENAPGESAAPESGETTDKARKPWAQRRIDELTRNWRETERDRDHWREVAIGKKTEQPAKPEEKTAKPEPKPEDFRQGDSDQFDLPAYLKAVRAYDREQLTKEASESAKKQLTEAETQRAQSAAESKVADEFRRQQDESRKKHHDYDDAYESVLEYEKQGFISKPVARAITTSEIAAELVYYLGTHADELEAVLRKPSIERQIAELGKIEARLALQEPAEEEEQPAPPSKPAPPPPPTPTKKSTATAVVPLEEMPFKDFVKAREAHLERKRK